MTEIKHEIDANFAGRLNILRRVFLVPMMGLFPSLESLSVLPVRRAISGLSFIWIGRYPRWCFFLWPVASMSLYPLRKDTEEARCR